MRSWLAPRRAQLIVHGEEPGDFAFASSSEFLVSERVKRSVTSRGLSGLEGFEEVEIASIVMRCETTPPPYFHVQPRLCGADVNGQRSVIERTDDILCAHCLTDGLEAIRGFEIDTASWTGADVFVPRGCRLGSSVHRAIPRSKRLRLSSVFDVIGCCFNGSSVRSPSRPNPQRRVPDRCG